MPTCRSRNAARSTAWFRMSSAAATAGVGAADEGLRRTRAPKRKLVRRFYYVSADDVLSSIDMAPGGALRPVALVDNIEQMQFEYAVDVDGDGTPDGFSATPADWTMVIGARPWLLARSTHRRNGSAAMTFAMGDTRFDIPAAARNLKRRVYGGLHRLPDAETEAGVMSRPRRRPPDACPSPGMVLMIGMVMLLLLTLVAVGVIPLSDHHGQVVGNAQVRARRGGRPLCARPRAEPARHHLGRLKTPRALDGEHGHVRSQDSGANSVNVTVADLNCQRARVIKNVELVKRPAERIRRPGGRLLLRRRLQHRPHDRRPRRNGLADRRLLLREGPARGGGRVADERAARRDRERGPGGGSAHRHRHAGDKLQLIRLDRVDFMNTQQASSLGRDRRRRLKAIAGLVVRRAAPARAEDIDLYSGVGGGVAAPNILFFLDNSSNWSAASQTWTKSVALAKCGAGYERLGAQTAASRT